VDDVGSGGEGVRRFILTIRNSGADIWNVTTSIREVEIRPCCEFGLKMRKLAIVKQRWRNIRRRRDESG
jgi:hypothetical protein